MSIFCAGCGQKLPDEEEVGAATAGRNPRSYTPRYLADKIIRGRSGMEGERRTVTVLFADALGFTPMSEQLGEEEIYRLMQECFACMMEAVHRYEGTVVQFTGDGVMAIFGAPIAHEDSARRAVAAGLEMQRALADYAAELRKRHDVDCRFRVGLNTGVVVVGKISDDLGMDFTALGDTVNLAQRMESAAEPGTVCLTESTFKAAGDFFECEALGELTVKGRAAPVVAHRALREKPLRSRLEIAAERGLTPFVGRSQELTVLRGYFEQAKRGRGQVVFVTGEAGLGKSRLLLEFRLSLIDEPVRWLEGNCVSYGKSTPYLPMAEMVKRNFGILDTDPESLVIARIIEATAAWSAGSRAGIPYLRYLLNVDPGDPNVLTMDPRVRQAGILDALRALVLEECDVRPVVILLEDLHWIDEKSEEALRALVDIVPKVRLLLVINHRAGYAHSLGDRTYFSRVALSILRPEESSTVAERVLQSDSLPPRLAELIALKGEGNPFYIEEVTRALVESGVVKLSNGTYVFEQPAERVEVPGTIQEVILSRIDRLDREARDAIQLASVIGREFTVRLLDRISEVDITVSELLDGLKTLELIYEKAYFPELSYMFKHALTHDVAYSTLLAERRKALHRLVGLAIEELYADRLEEHYEALAHHFDEGHDNEKAFDYAEKAGDKAAAAYANQDALAYYARAVEIGKGIGGERVRDAARVAQKRGELNFGIGDPDSAVEDFEEVRECAIGLGDRALEGLGAVWTGTMHYWGSDPQKGEACLREALVIASEGHAEVAVAANFWLGSMLMIYGNIEESRAYLREAEPSVRELGDPITHGFWAFMSGMIAAWEGRFDESLESLDQNREILDRTVFTFVGRLWNEALALAGKGRYSDALSRLHEVLVICERTGEVLVRARVLNTIGWVLGELQDHEHAVEWNRRSEQEALELGAPDPEIESNARLNLADSLCALGRADEAEGYYRLVEEVVRDPAPRQRFAVWLYSQHMFHSLGELCLARGDLELAAGYADECLQLAESTNRPKNVVKGRRLRGEVLLAEGKLGEAEQELEMALAIARELANPPQLWKTLCAISALRRAQGKSEDATAASVEAYAVIERVASDLTDSSLRQAFMESQHVRGICLAAEG